MYLDGGLAAPQGLIMRIIYSRKIRILSDISQRNFKGDLLELTQSRGLGMPRYDVIAEHGPDHEKKFHIQVMVNGESVGEGRGLSKKEAEQAAARQGLEKYLKRSE